MKLIVPEVFTRIIFACIFENHNTIFYTDAQCVHKCGSGLRKIGYEGDKYDVLTAVTVRSFIFWDCYVVVCQKFYDIKEEHLPYYTASHPRS
jgi:hypothetical protein